MGKALKFLGDIFKSFGYRSIFRFYMKGNGFGFGF